MDLVVYQSGTSLHFPVSLKRKPALYGKSVGQVSECGRETTSERQRVCGPIKIGGKLKWEKGRREDEKEGSMVEKEEWKF